MKKKIGKYISMLMKYTHAYLDRELKNLDIGRGEFSHLMILYQNDLVTQDHLAKSVHVDKGSTAKVVKSLLEQGYITRTINPDDKRAKLISLTDKAWELEKEITPVFKNWDNMIKSNISEEEFEIFYGVLHKMIDNAKNYHRDNYNEDNIDMCKGVCNER